MTLRALCILPLLLVLVDAPSKPTPASFRYTRPIAIASATAASPNACAILDASVYAHTGPTVSDLRLYTPSGDEIPYAITVSDSAAPTNDPAAILNLGLAAPRRIAFDLQMPARAYSTVDLTLQARDYIATARVAGLKSLADPHPTFLGTFTLFDLTAQGLGTSTAIPLTESTFPYLHVELTVDPAPGTPPTPIAPSIVAAANVPPSRQAQTLYTAVAETFTLAQRPRESVATFTLPAHVPVERVRVELDPAGTANFSRDVTVTAKTGAPDAPEESLSGEISRVRLTAQHIDLQSLTIPAILGANARQPATVEVAIQNGDDRPLRIRAVALEMRQRKLCFPTPNPAPSTSASLDYGAPDAPASGVAAPIYDFGRLFNPAGPTLLATLGPEQPNPAYRPPPAPAKSFTERHPALLWIALGAVLALLGTIALRSAKRL